MKKFLVFYVSPILTTILVVMKIPDIEDWLKTQNKYASLYIGIGVIIISLLIHFINVVSPFKKFEKIEKNKWEMMTLFITKFQDNYFKTHKLSVNVMVTKRCLFNRRQPKTPDSTKRKWNFFQKLLKVIWTFDGNPVDKRLIFTVKQGASGLAHCNGKPVLIDVKNDGNGELNLNSEQKIAISNLEFIISCPIFALDDRYSGKFSDRVIGILNVSCSYQRSRHLIEKPEDRSTITGRVMDFSKICSLIM